jgi:hypothetical protein
MNHRDGLAAVTSLPYKNPVAHEDDRRRSIRESMRRRRAKHPFEARDLMRKLRRNRPADRYETVVRQSRECPWCHGVLDHLKDRAWARGPSHNGRDAGLEVVLYNVRDADGEPTGKKVALHSKCLYEWKRGYVIKAKAKAEAEADEKTRRRMAVAGVNTDDEEKDPERLMEEREDGQA